MSDDKVVPIRPDEPTEFLDIDLAEVTTSSRKLRKMKKGAQLIQVDLINGKEVGFWITEDGLLIVDFLDNVDRPLPWAPWILLAISGGILIVLGASIVGWL